MLSKEKFLEYMNEFKELRDTTDELNLVLNKLCDDKLYRGLDRHDTLIINLIEELMNDKERLISNYIYEKEWGSIPNKSKINNLESLYDSIVNKYSR